MKNSNIFNLIVTLILLPLWLGLVTVYIEKIPKIVPVTFALLVTFALPL